MKSEPEIVDLIRKAWQTPQVRAWNPNKDARISVTLQMRSKPSGLILPPGLAGLPRAEPPKLDGERYRVTFLCETGTIDGTPVFRITGECEGVLVPIMQAPMTKPKPAAT